MDGEVLTEVPQKLQMLVRLVVRGFYTIEDILIIDMLVRNFCMSEDDLCDLLKFDRKMLRQRISTLRADRFIQARSKMVTVEDSKTQKEQYYFINYKSFVNVVKYKLDHMRKKLEMEERDQTSRASFVCHYCQRSYTDLEADQLLDIQTGQLQCIICKQEVQEDMSGMPRHDTRLLLTKFNEQMEPLFNLLREVENIKLAAKFSEPQPKDFSNLKRPGDNKGKGLDNSRAWSGDSTKKSGFQVEGSIDVNINAEGAGMETVKVKEKPIWLSDATSLITTKITSDTATPKTSTSGETKSDSIFDQETEIDNINMDWGYFERYRKKERKARKEKSKPDFKATPSSSVPQQGSGGGGGGSGADDVMVLLQTHERHPKKGRSRRASDSDSDDSDEVTKKKNQPSQPSAAARRYLAEPKSIPEDDVIELGDTDDEEEEEDTVPQVSVAGEQVAITEVDNALIARMTQEEKNAYMLMYQDYMCSPDD